MAGNKAKRAKLTHQQQTALPTSKPSAIYKPTKGRKWTVSVAVSGSIIANAVTHEQKTALAGQIARACAVFCVDEVIVYHDGQAHIRQFERDGYSAFANPDFFLHHILSYLETPPHLRRALFDMHPDLRSAGTLPSLDMPHHLRQDDVCEYREGYVLGPKNIGQTGSVLVNCGLSQPVEVPIDLDSNTRLTVKLTTEGVQGLVDHTTGEAVSPNAPREECGYFWGYQTRQANSLSAIFTECPFDGGYDLSIGTSERGLGLPDLYDPRSSSFVRSEWNHLLVVFGGVAGIEAAVAADEELISAGVTQASEVFDRWINLIPGQGSRTIRTEEALWIGLMGLAPLVVARTES